MILHTKLLFIHSTHCSPLSADEEAPDTAESQFCGPVQSLNNSPEQDQTVTLSNTPSTAEMVPPVSTLPGPDETIMSTER